MNVEFFLSRNATEQPISAKVSGKYTFLSCMSEMDREILHRQLTANDESLKCILAMKKNGMQNRDDRLNQFIYCNFSVLDKVDDLEEDGTLNFENVPCGHKGYKKTPCIWGKSYCVRKQLKD